MNQRILWIAMMSMLAVATVVLNGVRALLQMQNVQTLGSFRCRDEGLNRIWEVGAYTVKLCMQECLMDGIKRGRAPWLGVY